MVQYVIESERAAEAVFGFLDKRRSTLFDQVKGVRLDFRNNRKADELCATIAANPDVPVEAAPIEIRALLSARLVVFLSGVASMEADMHHVRQRPTDAEIVSLVFRRYLKRVRLPKEWDGLPYEPPPMPAPQALGADMGELT